jgi:hypothetical protein
MPSNDPDRYVVYWAEQRVLEITAAPGLLVSNIAPPPPPGAPLCRHPFLSATAFVPEHEQRLREILDRSDSVEAYLANLRAAGYVVVKEGSGHPDDPGANPQPR